MREINKEVVSVYVDDDKARYLNYKGDVILEVDLYVGS